MTQTYQIIHITADHAETPIGELAIDQAGQLQLLSASADQTEYLTSWVAKLNAQAQFVIKTSPPPGSEMLTLHGRTFTRDQPGFVADLKAYVRQLYGIKLATAAELAQEISDLGTQGL
jgi:hypothetical protein